jgi:hypothetical protein
VTTYTEDDHDQIAEVLTGRKIVEVKLEGEVGTLRLDDGTELTLIGHDGGCACSAGCYPLSELNGVDNVITKVEFEDNPSGDYDADYPNSDGSGTYKIFVFADNKRINLATFEGTDGNGYYGTGYSIEVRPAATDG